MGSKRKSIKILEGKLQRWRGDRHGAMTTEPDGEWVQYADLEPLFAKLIEALAESPDTDPVDAVNWIVRRAANDEKELFDAIAALDDLGVPHSVKKGRRTVVLDLAGRIRIMKVGVMLKVMAAWDQVRKDFQNCLGG